LTLDGTVKLGDLGLSRELSDNTLQAHSKVGTPLYMSPEVLRAASNKNERNPSCTKNTNNKV